MKALNRWLAIHSAVAVAFLYAPILVVVIHSFNASRRGGPWEGFTLEWYSALFASPAKLGAAGNTLLLAGTSTALSTVLGTLLGFGLSRHSFPGKRLIASLMYVPVVIPDIVAAIAMLLFFTFLRRHLGFFELGLPTMIIAHVTFQIPVIAILVRSRLSNLDPSLEEAAGDLGADRWQTFRWITLPLMMPGVFAGAALAFTLSIDDFVISFFTSGPGSATLPIVIYSSVKRGLTPDIHALSTLIIVASILGVLTVARLRRVPLEEGRR